MKKENLIWLLIGAVAVFAVVASADPRRRARRDAVAERSFVIPESAYPLAAEEPLSEEYVH